MTLHQLPTKIDGTMLYTFRACPTKFHRAYVQRKRGQFLEAGAALSAATPSPDTVAGSAFAAGLEAYRIAYYVDHLPLTQCLERAFLAATLSWDKRLDPFPPERKKGSEHLTDSKSLDRVLYAIHMYFKEYPIQGDDFQPEPTLREGTVSFEYSISLPLDFDPSWPLNPDTNEPFIFAGRCDGKGTYRSIPAFSDEKTTKTIGDTWPQQWAMRLQFIGYSWFFRLMAERRQTCLVRGVALQKTQLRFIEHVQRYPDHLLDTFERELKRDLWNMVAYREANDWPVRIGDACTSYGGCEFRDVCLASPQNHASLLSTYGFNDWIPGEPHPQPNLIATLRSPYAHA